MTTGTIRIWIFINVYKIFNIVPMMCVITQQLIVMWASFNHVHQVQLPIDQLFSFLYHSLHTFVGATTCYQLNSITKANNHFVLVLIERWVLSLDVIQLVDWHDGETNIRVIGKNKGRKREENLTYSTDIADHVKESHNLSVLIWLHEIECEPLCVQLCIFYVSFYLC